jgi:hypothetical protein
VGGGGWGRETVRLRAATTDADVRMRGRSQFSRQCARQAARRVCTPRTAYSACCTARGCTAARRGAAGMGRTRDNEKCTRRDILLARRPSYNCRERDRERESRLNLSIFPSPPPPRSPAPLFSSPNPGFPLRLVSLMRPPLARSSGKQRASGLLNNSLCGLTERERERERERDACARALTRGYFAKLPASVASSPSCHECCGDAVVIPPPSFCFFPAGKPPAGGGAGVVSVAARNPEKRFAGRGDFNGYGFQRVEARLREKPSEVARC